MRHERSEAGSANGRETAPGGVDHSLPTAPVSARDRAVDKAWTTPSEDEGRTAHEGTFLLAASLLCVDSCNRYRLWYGGCLHLAKGGRWGAKEVAGS